MSDNEMEKELLEEKMKEKKFEEKVRTLRKERNKGRISRGNEPAPKRQKPEDGEYISIRKTWGKPKKNSY